jgi:SAM-dependent methyltransferase
MKTRTDLINAIAKKINAKSYIEIGVYNPDHNFNHIDVDTKISIDPDPKAGAYMLRTSDEFFKIAKALHTSFDLIFIDGLHHADQVKRDIQNAWDCLNPGGVIVLHDCNPPTEATTCVPRGSQREWCGNTYQAVLQCRDVLEFTTDFDYGCAVIREQGPEWPLDFTDEQLTWKEFDENRKQLMKLKSSEEVEEIINAWI